MILLLNPKPKLTQFNRYLEPFVFNTMPISLGFLAGYLEAKGIKSEILDEQLADFTYYYLKDKIVNSPGPKIIGITVLTSTYKRSCEIARMIKDMDPSALVVIGGIHPTAVFKECLQEPFFDIVVRGEGEETFYNIVKSANNGILQLSSINGISYKESGKIINNVDGPLIEDLDDIPPFPYHLFERDIDKYKGFGIIISSRGCPFKCIFCSARLISKHKYRTHSLERISKNLDLLINKYKQTKISFLDDNIVCNKEKFFEVVDMIVKNNFHKKASFFVQVRGKDVDREFCEKLKQGNFEIAINFEAGTNRMLKYIKKAETIEEIKDGILEAKAHGINVTSVFIFGFPGETEEDRREAVRLTRKLPIDSARFNLAVPYPGTELNSIVRFAGMLNIQGRYENFTIQHYMDDDNLAIDLPTCEKYNVIFDTFWANISFYLRQAFFVKNLFNRNFAGHAISFNFKHPVLIFKSGFMLTLVLIKRFVVIFLKKHLYRMKK